MFARKLHITLHSGEAETPVPRGWLDQFFMRNFTGYRAFDETLPAGDGLLEAGFAVEPEELRQQLEKWLRGRKMIAPETELRVSVS